MPKQICGKPVAIRKLVPVVIASRQLPCVGGDNGSTERRAPDRPAKRLPAIGRAGFHFEGNWAVARTFAFDGRQSCNRCRPATWGRQSGGSCRALADLELGQKLPSQPQHLAQSRQTAILATETGGTNWSRNALQLLAPPPVGGKHNDLDGTSRTLRILQVAVLATALVIALTILVSGLFRTFG